MPRPQYVLVCKSIGCNPNDGLDIDHLRLVYASGANVEEDYLAVFSKKKEISSKDKDDDNVL